MKLSVYLALIFLLLIQNCFAENTLIPYVGAPPEINLTQADHSILRKNKSVYKKFETVNGEQLAIVFRVSANTFAIWETIRNYAKYPEWVKNVKETEIYKEENNNIYVRFLLKHWYLGKFQYYMKHDYSALQDGWVTWKLDNDFESDFISSIGFWKVYPAKDNQNHSYVMYSTNVLFKKRKSAFIHKRTIKSSLKQASSWVKKYSEQ